MAVPQLCRRFAVRQLTGGPNLSPKPPRRDRQVMNRLTLILRNADERSGGVWAAGERRIWIGGAWRAVRRRWLALAAQPVGPPAGDGMPSPYGAGAAPFGGSSAWPERCSALHTARGSSAPPLAQDSRYDPMGRPLDYWQCTPLSGRTLGFQLRCPHGLRPLQNNPAAKQSFKPLARFFWSLCKSRLGRQNPLAFLGAPREAGAENGGFYRVPVCYVEFVVKSARRLPRMAPRERPSFTLGLGGLPGAKPCRAEGGAIRAERRGSPPAGRGTGSRRSGEMA